MAGGSGDEASLNPHLIERISRALRPQFLRTTTARRVVAALLVLLAGAAALRPDAAGRTIDVVTATTDLRPGHTVTAADVRLEKRSAATVPDGALTRVEGIVGFQTAGPCRRGEILTDARVLGSRLAGVSAGPDARVVGLRLAEAGMLEVVRPGDVVDVLGAAGADRESPPRVLATAAVVVGVSTAPASPTSGADRLLLIALPSAAAATVAAAGLVSELALTLR